MIARLRTLTWRLVAIAVLLVAVTATVIGAVTTLGMRDNLDLRLDADVRDALRRAVDGPGGPPPGDDAERDNDFGPGQPVGTVTALVSDAGQLTGRRLAESDGGLPEATPLTDAQLDVLADVASGDRPVSLDLPDLGSYRVLAADVAGGQLVVGLPRAEAQDTVDDLVRLELLTTLLSIGAAALVGAFVVRRQLAPLRDVARTANRVAELPLATGEIDLGERVPERLADERTEVGQVGSALNTLLDHVEDSLAARHRSELQVRQFVADASHELRTPLATIAGYSELARRRPDDGVALRTALSKVDEESQRMKALVEDLLLLARLDTGRPLARESVDLTSLLLEAVIDARVLAPKHHWRLELPDQALEVRGDEQRLHQVITNLLTNARKHTPPGTTVTVAANAGGFSVHDDGPGFDEELTERAFERFTRGDRARHREGGVGLGLALVAAIVGALGGQVTLESRTGDTTVRVQLPQE